MKNILLLLYLLYFPLNSFDVKSQINTIGYTESTPFDISNSWTKLKQVKNGNTYMIRFYKNNILIITFFDKNGIQINQDTISLNKYRSNKFVSFLNFLDYDDRLTLFFSQTRKKSEILFSLQFDNNTGKLIDQKLLLEMPPTPFGAYFAMKSGNTGSPFIEIQTDEINGCYGVMCFTPFAVTDERIKMYHYNHKDEIILEKYFQVPNKYKYVDFVNLFVNGSESLILVCNAYNTFFRGGKKKSVLLFSKIRQKDDTIAIRTFETEYYFRNYQSINVFDPKEKRLNFLMDMNIKSNKYMSGYVAVETDSLNLLEATNLPFEFIDSLYTIKTSRKMPNNIGFPQLYDLNYDGNSFLLHQNHNDSRNTLGEIIVTCFDKKGNGVYTEVIPCNYRYLDKNIRFNYHYNGRNLYVNPPNHDINLINYPGLRYFNIFHCPTSKYSYIFMNDHINNYNLYGKSIEKAKREKDLQLIGYRYNNQTGFKDKFIVNKSTLITSKHSYYNTQSYDYRKESNKLAILLIGENFQLYKKVYSGKIVWIELE